MNKNIAITNTTSDSNIHIQVGTGYSSSYLKLEEGYDFAILTPTGEAAGPRQRVLSSDRIRLYAADLFANNLVVTSRIDMENGLNIGCKVPISSTTNRIRNVNSKHVHGMI